MVVKNPTDAHKSITDIFEDEGDAKHTHETELAPVGGGNKSDFDFGYENSIKKQLAVPSTSLNPHHLPPKREKPANASGTFAYLRTWDPLNAHVLHASHDVPIQVHHAKLENIFDDESYQNSFRNSNHNSMNISAEQAKVLTEQFANLRAEKYLHSVSGKRNSILEGRRGSLSAKTLTHCLQNAELNHSLDATQSLTIVSVQDHVPKVMDPVDESKFFWGNVAIFCVCLGVTLLFCLWHIPENDHNAHLSYLNKYDSWMLGTTYACDAAYPVEIEVDKGHRAFFELRMIIQEAVNGEVYYKLLQEIKGVPEEILGRTDIKLSKDLDISTEYLIEIDMDGKGLKDDTKAYIRLYTTSETPVSVFFELVQMNGIARYRVLISGLLLLVIYIIIGLEVVHRTLVALVGAFATLFFLTLISSTPSMAKVMSYMDEGTLSLLFGMMVIVATLSKTGVFEYLAVQMVVFSSEKDESGQELCNLFKLTVCMCLFSGIVSAFLDNVTTLLLLSPVTCRLCKMILPDDAEKLAIPLLIANAVFGNVGGTMTLIGAIPNVIIGTRLSQYLDFMDFIFNLMPAVILQTPLIIGFIRWRYADSLVGQYPVNLDDLNAKYPVKDKILLTRAGMIACFVVLLLFLHPLHHQQSGWVALVGAIGIMLLGSNADLHFTLLHVEWDTLLFFAGLFVMIAAMADLGLIRWIGDMIIEVIISAPEADRLMVAIVLILWVSSFTSGFLSNIAFAATMVPVIKIIGEDEELNLPMKPLAWALSFGTCMGGNLTLVGSAASLVAAGVAEHNGMHIGFLEFSKTGAPVWLITTICSTLYCLVVYVWLGW